MRRGGSPERGSSSSRAVEPKRITHKAVLMQLSARLRVPLAGFALCSTALLISACGGSSGSDNKKVPSNAVAVVSTETVPNTKLDTLLSPACVQYKTAKTACPKQ